MVITMRVIQQTISIVLTWLTVDTPGIINIFHNSSRTRYTKCVPKYNMLIMRVLQNYTQRLYHVISLVTKFWNEI
jgi:hypothetical protein